MTLCSFLISPSALWPRGLRNKKTPSLSPLHNTLYNQNDEQFKINTAAQPAKEKKSAAVNPEQHTVSNQYWPYCPPGTCWKRWETSHLVCFVVIQISHFVFGANDDLLFEEESIELFATAAFSLSTVKDKIQY